MSAHKFHSDISETVPWQAQYTFPTQSTKVHKQTIKLVPKNGGEFGSNARTRIEFPADDYMNGLNSYMSFDLVIDDEASASLMRYCTQKIEYTVQNTNYTNVIVGAGDSRRLTITDSGNINDQNYNKQWDSFYNGNADLDGGKALAGCFVRVVQGSKAGKVARILQSAANLGIVTLTLDDKLEVYEFDIIEIVPGNRLPFGGAHNLINRLRIMYGSLAIEDIQNYSTLARAILTAGADAAYGGQQGSLLDGMASAHANYSTTNWRSQAPFGSGGVDDAVSELSQSISKLHDSTALINKCLANNMHPSLENVPADPYQDLGYSTAINPPNFTLNLFSGFLCTQKLIPLKWMAAQLAVEIEWNPAERCLLSAATPDYSIRNVNYVTELYQFDSTYDSAFYMGLSTMGVPLKFSSWHYHQFNWTGSTLVAQIQERARSVKSILAVTRDATRSYYYDNDRFYHAVGEKMAQANDQGLDKYQQKRFPTTKATMGRAPITEFQFRVGGRYFPAQPVSCTNGAAEALCELMKVMNYLGDYTRSISIDMFNWSSLYMGGGDKFIIAGCFENTDAFPGTISGLNAEEQSDIQLTIRTGDSALTAPGQQPDTSKQLSVFVNYDSIVVVRDNNLIDLVL